jgi:tetratricopeptide (TPR) repeat protein
MMGFLIRSLFTGLLAGFVLSLEGADAASSWIEAGLAAEGRMDPRAALDSFRKADEVRPNDPFILQKIARQLSDAAFQENDEEERPRLVREALPYAQRAAELDPSSAVNRLSLAILYGKLALYGDIRTKVEYTRAVRGHAEEALALDPNYAWACHVLGRWHVEVSALGLARRAAVALFLGGLPRASIEEGVRLLEKAVDLEGNAVAHRVELGFAYVRAGRSQDAEACWRKALKMPAHDIYESIARQRAIEALGRYAVSAASSDTPG